jgi:hypothetical protein
MYTPELPSLVQRLLTLAVSIWLPMSGMVSLQHCCCAKPRSATAIQTCCSVDQFDDCHVISSRDELDCQGCRHSTLRFLNCCCSLSLQCGCLIDAFPSHRNDVVASLNSFLTWTLQHSFSAMVPSLEFFLARNPGNLIGFVDPVCPGSATVVCALFCRFLC